MPKKAKTDPVAAALLDECRLSLVLVSRYAANLSATPNVERLAELRTTLAAFASEVCAT